MRQFRTILFLFLTFAIFSSASLAQMRSPRDEAIERAKTGVDVLLKWYDKDKGTWRGWWNSANSLTAIIRYCKFTGSRSYAATIKNTFEKNKGNKFLNEFYDDEGWWALAWVEAYELTKNVDYLKMAQVIFEDMTNGYAKNDKRPGFSGGIYWKKDHKNMNAIENGLFILLALRLNEHKPLVKVDGLTYLDWAKKIWEWYEKSGMINTNEYFIEDAMKPEGGLINVHFTYNQGVTMAASLEFYKITKNKKYLTLSEKLAETTMKRMVTSGGILRDFTDGSVNDDCDQFKGVFMRHLYTLYEVTKKPEYKNFIIKNANEIWKNRNKKTNQFNGPWSEPCQETTSIRHTSALDCLVSAIGVRTDIEDKQLIVVPDED